MRGWKCLHERSHVIFFLIVYWLLSDKTCNSLVKSHFPIQLSLRSTAEWSTVFLISCSVFSPTFRNVYSHISPVLPLLSQSPNWETGKIKEIETEKKPSHRTKNILRFAFRQMNALLIAFLFKTKCRLFTLCWFAGLSSLHFHLSSLSFVPDCKQSSGREAEQWRPSTSQILF